MRNSNTRIEIYYPIKLDTQSGPQLLLWRITLSLPNTYSLNSDRWIVLS